MRSARVAEKILSQVLAPDRAASTVGDWLEDSTERGHIWFWSCVFRTVLSRIWRDIAGNPALMLGLALRGCLYELWLIVGTSLLGVCMLIPVVLLAGYVGRHLHWHPSWPLQTPWIAQVWIGWIQFKTARWIAHRAPGRELAAGVTAYLAPIVFFSLVQLLAMHFWGPEIDRFIASHPDSPGSMPTLLPSEIFLLAGIFWSRRKFLRSVER